MKRNSGYTQPLLSKPISMILWVVVLTLFGFLAVGSLLMQKQLRQDTDLRGKASVGNGIVEISSPTTTLKFGEDSPILLTVNTQQTQISGIQLTLNLEVTGENQQFGTGFAYKVTNPKLRLADWNGKATSTGYQYQFMILPTVPGSPFSTAVDEPLITFNLTPASTNAYVLSFVQDKTIATQYQTADQDVLHTAGSHTYNVVQDTCSYTYGAWSSCQNGKQIRTYTANPTSCAAPDAAQLERTCLPQCSYVYSDWSACSNGWKTRTVTTDPANCSWYQTEAVQELSQACETVSYNPNFGLYTYEACWYDRTVGNSVYVLWNKAQYPDVTAVDVSIFSDFRDFAHKDVTGATSTLGDTYLVTDGTNFRTYSDGKNSLYSFYPDVNYYFRLWNGSHSSVVRFYIPKCAGVGGVSYKQCNETCSSNAECSPNLTCSSGLCRRAGNVDSTSCVLPPDKGLNRSCNEYCADSRECAAGLTCYYNRCRNPKNQTETSCKAPTRQVAYRVVDRSTGNEKGSEDGSDTTTAQCNETCASNRDCSLGLRCYENRCRLPANLASLVCSVTELGTEPTPTEVATSAGTVVKKPSISPSVGSDTQKTSTASSSRPAWITTVFSKLPFILGGILLIVIALLVLPMVFASGNRRDTTSTYQKTTLNELEQQRIDQLKQNIGMQTPKTEATSSMVDRLKQRGVQPPGI